MKKNLLLTSVLIAIFSFALNAQTIVDFESLTVPSEGYYNGSTDYSGSGDTETFYFSDNGANFYVRYTDTGTYDYWDAFAYSNQTDLTTADWTNYSAYANPAGGANNSSNYVIAFTYSGDSVSFENTVRIDSVKITNSVWAYHYMNGSDGSGSGTYEDGDYFILTVTGIDENNEYTGSVDFYLADFTDGNSYIIDNWTNVDLSSLGNVKGLKFSLSALDSNTPLYFCMDNITYSDAVSTENILSDNVEVYPNPVKTSLNITNVLKATVSISDISGKTFYTKNNCDKTEIINTENLSSGIYFVKIQKENTKTVKKFIKQ
ncbi:MAG: DUF4465 domain-containing protein [Chlorobi bacterium]|nr:DUF4465 domain-containing protein [Chlorobiota bacterium]